MGQSGYAAGRGEKGNSLDPPDFGDAFLCIAVEAGLEKRRYLLFASSAQQKLSIRYVFHGAGASRRNSDAQKANSISKA